MDCRLGFIAVSWFLVVLTRCDLRAGGTKLCYFLVFSIGLETVEVVRLDKAELEQCHFYLREIRPWLSVLEGLVRYLSLKLS